MANETELPPRAYRPPDTTLRYGQHADHLIDVRLPPYAHPRPLVVVVHGGFWRTAYDRAHAGPQSAALAEEGYVVATIEYRRVGPFSGGWPETFDDLARAFDRLPSLLDQHAPGRVQPGSMVLMGHSAGAQLALWSAGRHRLHETSTWHRAEPLSVSAVLSLAGVTDLVRADELGLSRDAASALLGGPAGAHPQRYAATNPMALLPLGVRTTLIHGDADDLVPVELSRSYAQRAKTAGDEVTLIELAGVGHFDLIDPESGAWPTVLEALAEQV